jgi:hypothetical protein
MTKNERFALTIPAERIDPISPRSCSSGNAKIAFLQPLSASIRQLLTMRSNRSSDAQAFSLFRQALRSPAVCDLGVTFVSPFAGKRA